MRLDDLNLFARELKASLAALDPVRESRALIHRVLTAEPGAWESNEQQLLRSIVERMDATTRNEDEWLVLVRDVQELLKDASSRDAIELLFELILERERVASVLGKFAHGTIGRTNLISFIGEQRWPGEVRQRMAALSKNDLVGLMSALENTDIPHLEALLVP